MDLLSLLFMIQSFIYLLPAEPAIKANHINPALIGDVGDRIISTMNAALILPPHEPQVKKQE